MSHFGFEVFYFQARHPKDVSGWQVRLPHQCQEWDIVPDPYEDAVSQEKAIEGLEAFIAEAQQALEALRKGESFGEGS